ncbi:polymeric immunoglobulin receptor isoform X2 [Neoarius graeffei]|uniref:polymeric immunoglobulin receptor isoform X2 n=1 Tax=Neoarius graeffei TaxID=443677 RepID=UPI00298CA0A1|nr:polymeric immunoglobulin receptor isoform X2 [Neoarius graeffei]
MMMIMELLLLTILISGKLSVTWTVPDTVVNVPVQQGKSIIIPYLYDVKYINCSKYLCFGHSRHSCKDVKEMKHRMVSTLDDQTQHIFTVTMKNVSLRDAGHYWCSVEGPSHYERKHFQLNVTKATPELYVDDQMVTGYEGSHMVIFCHHPTKQPKAWCKIGDACVSTTGNISGTLVQLSSVDGGFRVTMSKLTMDNTGWYWCSAGNEQMPVHITVRRDTHIWERRSSFAWLVFLGLLLALAYIAVTVFQQHHQTCEMFSLPKRSENLYVSMKKPKLQTTQHEDEHIDTQEYEIMSSPGQELEGSGEEP